MLGSGIGEQLLRRESGSAGSVSSLMNDERVAERIVAAHAEILFGGTDAEVVGALVVGHHLAFAVEHALDQLGRLLHAVDDRAEQDAPGVVGELGAGVAPGAGRSRR